MQSLAQHFWGIICGMLIVFSAYLSPLTFLLFIFLDASQVRFGFKFTGFVWQLMALLLLRHALTITDADTDGDDDTSTFFSVRFENIGFYFRINWLKMMKESPYL